MMKKTLLLTLVKVSKVLQGLHWTTLSIHCNLNLYFRTQSKWEREREREREITYDTRLPFELTETRNFTFYILQMEILVFHKWSEDMHVCPRLPLCVWSLFLSLSHSLSLPQFSWHFFASFGSFTLFLLNYLSTLQMSKWMR